MSEALVLEIGRKTLFTIMILSAPLLIVALVVGLTVSIFQAATSINEMTLTFIPKIVSISLSLLLFLPLMLQLYKGFINELFQLIPSLLR